MVAGPEISRLISQFEEYSSRRKNTDDRHHDNSMSAMNDYGNPFLEDSEDIYKIDSKDIVQAGTGKLSQIKQIGCNQAALLEHTKRATYQGGHVWGQAVIHDQHLPSPGDWGWVKENADGMWIPHWTQLAAIAASCQELHKCGCKKTCSGRFDRKRAHAGVAICVNNKYSPYLEKLPDGSNRIAAIRLNFDVPLVIISVYLPSRSINYSRDDYLSVLDELIEIVTKYRDSANILIGGDMNASIFRNHPRDNDFKNFLRNNNLRIPDNCVECSTFYHFNNRDESQIDYFIQNFDIINTYCTYSRESANTSTHDPIMVSVIIKTSDKPNAIPKSKHLQRINWNKIDKCEYQRLMELNLQ
ncbi:unnamed protein product [Mytilus edulis]|uniref:Endonuclease/exonuclease/phosphatase domain-containing protein n=1 Tax=Mytilus edulis TaxID=6550 RepID=A0A8S3PSB2_MYTED|nr:unnamed protein product [Mytilus edulis]